MFQYALGRALTIRNNGHLMLDISEYTVYDLHQYSLDRFKIVANYADDVLIAQYQLTMPYNTVQEYKYEFDETILQLRPPIHLSWGCWESYKYFENIRNILLDEFYPMAPLSTMDKQIEEQIHNCKSASIHVRRGDRISDPVANETHGVPSLDY